MSLTALKSIFGSKISFRTSKKSLQAYSKLAKVVVQNIPQNSLQ